MVDVLLLLTGLVLLYFGAEWLVAGAAGLARSLGVQPLIVGLTVVAYGTSAPELVVGVSAGLQGQGAIALGNVVGSNIANLGLILGTTALVLPAAVDRDLLRREVPMLALTTAAIPILFADGQLTWLESVALLAVAIGYTAWMVRSARRGSVSDAAAVAEDAATAGALGATRARWRLGLRALAGLALLIAGGYLLVEGAVGLARTLGMSERIIGLTIVAVGTSLPELATSLIAAVRGHSDLAVGNVLGSNIFNVLLILGATGLAGQLSAPLAGLGFDLLALGAMTLLAMVAMATSRRVSRHEGAALVLGYLAFLVALVLR